jgi:tetratricopeptide (TPR) repeat protein
MRLRREAGLNGWVHARLAALYLASGRSDEGVIESYAYLALDPSEPDAWRKWASAQLAREQYEPALASLERYLAMSGSGGESDREAQRVAESLRRLVHGDIAHRALRTGEAP